MDASCCRTTNSIGEPRAADPTAAMMNRMSRVSTIMVLPFCWDELILPDKGSRQRKNWRTSRLRMRWARGAGEAGQGKLPGSVRGQPMPGRSSGLSGVLLRSAGQVPDERPLAPVSPPSAPARSWIPLHLPVRRAPLLRSRFLPFARAPDPRRRICPPAVPPARPIPGAANPGAPAPPSAFVGSVKTRPCVGLLHGAAYHGWQTRETCAGARWETPR